MSSDSLRTLDACSFCHSGGQNPHTVTVGPAASRYTMSGALRGANKWTAQEPPIPASSVTTRPPTGTPATDPDGFKMHEKRSIFVAGALAIDISCDYGTCPGHTHANDAVLTPALHNSNPATISQSLGGVGSNVARAACQFGVDVHLCSAVGDDLSGRSALDMLGAAGLSTAGIKKIPKKLGGRTACYVAANDSAKDLMLAMADMSILESQQRGPGTVMDALENFWIPQLKQAQPSHLVLDGNWPPEHIARWLETARAVGTHVTFEPVSPSKSTRIFKLPQAQALQAFPRNSLHLATPNVHELKAMHCAASEAGLLRRKDRWDVDRQISIPQLKLSSSDQLVDEGIPQLGLQLLPFIPSLCIKLGQKGVLLAQLFSTDDPRLHRREYSPYIISRCKNDAENSHRVGGIYMRLFPAVERVPTQQVVSVNGVGDTFAGTVIAGLACRRDRRIEDLVDFAQKAAVLTLKSLESVSSRLGSLKTLI